MASLNLSLSTRDYPNLSLSPCLHRSWYLTSPESLNTFIHCFIPPTSFPIQVLFIFIWTATLACVLSPQSSPSNIFPRVPSKNKIWFLQWSLLPSPHCLSSDTLLFHAACNLGSAFFSSHIFYDFLLHITGLSHLLVCGFIRSHSHSLSFVILLT